MPHDPLEIPGLMALSPSVRQALSDLWPAAEAEGGRGQLLDLGVGPAGEGVVPYVLPYRLNANMNALMKLVEAARGDEQVFLLCLASRHGEGTLREACIRRLLPMPQSWVSPFVVALLGEYVREIAVFIHRALDEASLGHLRAFAQRNPAFMRRTERRVISYWDAYSREVDACYRLTPAWQALQRIQPIIATHV